MAVENYASKANLSSILTKVETKLANRYTKAETASAIASAIAGVTQFNYTIVDELPASGTKGTIYLVANEGSSPNLYDEYIWIVVEETGSWEKLGWQELDLSGYLVGTDVKVDTTHITKTADVSGNGFTIGLAAADVTSLGKADTAVQKTDLSGTANQITVTPAQSGNGATFALDSAVTTSLGKADTAVQKTDVSGTTNQIVATPAQSGNGVTLSLDSAVTTSLGKADTALQPSDVEPLSTADVNELLAILTTDDAS